MQIPAAPPSPPSRWRRLPRPAPAAKAVVFEPWKPRFYALVVGAAIVVGIIGGVGVTLLPGRGPVGRNEWHLWTGWERETLPNVLFGVLGIGPDPRPAEGENAIRNYFRLTSEIAAAPATDAEKARTLASERQRYENDLEHYVEGLIDEAIGAAGLKRSLPLFPGVRFTWPPVNFELTSPPQILVRSPRNAIKRAGDTLLKPDLSLADAEAIERATDNDDTVSIVEPIGGLAAYPAVVSADRSYHGWLDTTAHEWVHHYLAFFPLGEEWGRGGDAVTLNETVASLAGREIAKLIRERHPLNLPAGQDGSPPPRTCTAEPIDFNKEMRALRLQVDALLADGKVDEAEKAMNDKRQFFEEHCIHIRKINQAYFAFHGSYADSAAASDPIGPKVEQVLTLAGNVGNFLQVMRGVRTVADLDASLAALRAGK